MKYKIFEEKNIQEAIDNALKEGFDIADIEQCIKYKKETGFNEWLDTSIVWLNCNPRSATTLELKNMKAFYERGGRWLVLGGNCFNNNLSGYYCFDYDGRVLGVKRMPKTTKEIINDIKGVILDFPNDSCRDEYEIKKDEIWYSEEEVKELKQQLLHCFDKDEYRRYIQEQLRKQAEAIHTDLINNIDNIYPKIGLVLGLNNKQSFVSIQSLLDYIEQKYLDSENNCCSHPVMVQGNCVNCGKLVGIEDKFRCIICKKRVSVKKGSGIIGDVICDSKECELRNIFRGMNDGKM